MPLTYEPEIVVVVMNRAWRHLLAYAFRPVHLHSGDEEFFSKIIVRQVENIVGFPAYEDECNEENYHRLIEIMRAKMVLSVVNPLVRIQEFDVVSEQGAYAETVINFRIAVLRCVTDGQLDRVSIQDSQFVLHSAGVWDIRSNMRVMDEDYVMDVLRMTGTVSLSTTRMFKVILHVIAASDSADILSQSQALTSMDTTWFEHRIFASTMPGNIRIERRAGEVPIVFVSRASYYG